MKKIFMLAATVLICAVAVTKSSAQYDGRYHRYQEVRHERADIRRDEYRAERLRHDAHVDAYYGNRPAYRHDERRYYRTERDINRDRRYIRRERY